MIRRSVPNHCWRFLFLLLLLPLAPAPAHAQAQITSVTATVKDANGTAYANCTWSATFSGSTSTPVPYGPAPYLNGQQGVCDSTGKFSVSLADNSVTIFPPGSQWAFSICAPVTTPGGPYCLTNFAITITGASQDLTSTLQPKMPLLPGSAPSAGGHLLLPVVVASLAQYTSFGRGTTVPVSDGASSSDCSTGLGSTNVVCQWNGTSWSAVGGSGSGTVASCATTGALALYTAATTTGCGNADFTYATHTLTMGASGLADFSAGGANSFKTPVIAGGTSGAAGVLVYDSTAKLSHQRTNDADSISMAVLSTDTTTSHVVQPTATAGVYTSAAISCSTLSNAAASCSTDATVATNITSGTLGASVVLGNGVTATTQSAGDNSTKVATTAYADLDKMWAGGTSTAGAPSGTQFIFASGTSAGLLASAGAACSLASRAGTVDKLYANMATTETGTSIAFTVTKGGSTQTPTCTINNGAATCNDTGHSFSFVAGDCIAVQTVQSGTGTSTTYEVGIGYR